MFENSLMESAGKIKANRMWKGLALIVELLAVGFLIALPLIHPEMLPARLTESVLLAPPPVPAPSRPATHAQAQQPKTTVPILDIERVPDTIAKGIPVENPSSAPPSGGGEGTGDSPTGVLGGGLAPDNPAPPPKADPTPTPAPTPTKPQRVSSGVMEASLIHRIEPPYPPIARIAHVQGDVTFQAFISKQGIIENLRPIGAVHPMLLQAALDAVRQWRYRPTLLNGEPIEVETTITIRFHI